MDITITPDIINNIITGSTNSFFINKGDEDILSNDIIYLGIRRFHEGKYIFYPKVQVWVCEVHVVYIDLKKETIVVDKKMIYAPMERYNILKSIGFENINELRESNYDTLKGVIIYFKHFSEL